MTRILIQGIGAVGGLLTGELLRAGEEVTLITSNPKITEAINANGISVTTPDDAFHVPARAYTHLDDIDDAEPFDCAYLAMMAGQVVDSATAAVPYLTEDGFVVSFQNGFVEEAIGKAVGIHRVVSATVALGSTMEAPGVYRRTTQGRLIIGELDGRHSARLDTLCASLAHVVETEISQNIVGVLWGKLIWNGAVSCLCAISGKMLGELFDSDIGCELFLQAFRESVDTARAQGIDIEHVIVDPQDYYVGISDSAARCADVLAKMAPFVGKYAGVTPSTLESLKRGRKSEIDFLNGYILEKARESGVSASLNEAVIPLVHAIEVGDRKIDPANLLVLRNSL